MMDETKSLRDIAVEAREQAAKAHKDFQSIIAEMRELERKLEEAATKLRALEGRGEKPAKKTAKKGVEG